MKIVLFVHQSSEMYGSDKVLLFLAQGLQVGGQFHPVVVLPESGGYTLPFWLVVWRCISVRWLK